MQRIPGGMSATGASNSLRRSVKNKSSYCGRGESRVSNCCQIDRPRRLGPCTSRAAGLNRAKNGENVGFVITECYSL